MIRRIKAKIALGIGAILLIASLAFAVMYKAPEHRIFNKRKSDTLYTLNCGSAMTLTKQDGVLVAGPCSIARIKFILMKDSIFLESPDRPALGYKITKVDLQSGLHALRGDSTEVIFYNYIDKRDSTKAFILMVQPHTSLVFFELPTCAEIGK